VSASNVELARRGYESLLRGEFETIRELLDPEISWHGGDPSADGACRNREQAITFMERARRGGAPRARLVDVLDAGDRVVVVFDGTPGDRGGRRLSANVTTFRAGKVVEMVHYVSAADALTATGLSTDLVHGKAASRPA
jgi:ketosteroid isomerase-like protein